MKHFIVYDKQTREIISKGACPAKDVKLQAVNKTNAAAIMHKLNGDKVNYRVDKNGQVVRKTQKEIDAIKDKSSNLRKKKNENTPIAILSKDWQAVLDRLDRLEKGN